MRRGDPRPHLLEVELRWPPETFLQLKLEHLLARGFRVTVASPSRQTGVTVPWSSESELDGVKRIRLPSKREKRTTTVAGIVRDGLALLLSRPRDLAAAVGAARSARRGGVWETARHLRAFLPVARVRPDIVHFEWESTAARYLPLMDACGCRFVTSSRGSHLYVYPHGPRNRPLLENISGVFASASASHCVSAAMAREASRYGLDPAKTRVIRPAVDTSFFTPGPGAERPSHELRVISVGWFRWVKGYEYALQAIRHLVDEGVPVRFTLVGDGDDRRRILFTIEDLGLERCVELPGTLTPAEVRSRLREADVLLQPSLSEGLPGAVLEAMACGLPVVVTDCGGVREAVTDGVEGIVVPRRDPRRMASALEKLHEDPELRRSFGRAGRARVEAEFTLAEQAEKWFVLYDAVARGELEGAYA